MLSMEELMSIENEKMQEAAKVLNKDELQQLVELLCEKDDKLRYQALLLLKARSLSDNSVYQYWDIFKEKLNSENSYQRSIGLMLIAGNAEWDEDNRLEDTIDDYLQLLTDEKPITVRQCIQALSNIVTYKKNLQPKITKSLLSIDLQEVRETMRKSILIDILNVLAIIRKYQTSDEIERYIRGVLSGDLLDKKAKKQMEETFNFRIF